MIRGNESSRAYRMLEQFDSAKNSIISRALEPYFQEESFSRLEESSKADELEQNLFLTEYQELVIMDHYFGRVKRMGQVLTRKLTEYSEYYDANAQLDDAGHSRTNETGRIHDSVIAWDVAHAIKPEIDKTATYSAAQSLVSSKEITKKILKLEVAAEEIKQLAIEQSHKKSEDTQPSQLRASRERTFSLCAVGSDELEG